MSAAESRKPRTAAGRTLPRPATPSGKRLYNKMGRRKEILAIEAEAAPASGALTQDVVRVALENSVYSHDHDGAAVMAFDVLEALRAALAAPQPAEPQP